MYAPLALGSRCLERSTFNSFNLRLISVTVRKIFTSDDNSSRLVKYCGGQREINPITNFHRNISMKRIRLNTPISKIYRKRTVF